MKSYGTISIGVKTPIFKTGDDLIGIVINSVLRVCSDLKLSLEDKDIIAVTESALARVQGNYVSRKDISNDISNKYPEGNVGVLFPITSRNRFSEILKGIAEGNKGTTYVQLSYPKDEVGNPIISEEKYYEIAECVKDGSYNSKDFKKMYGEYNHPFTEVNYLEFYEKLHPNIKVILSNDPRAILGYTKNILIASIHRRNLDRKILENKANRLYDLSEILNERSSEHGFNEQYGLLGSNLSKEGVLKLFPRDGQPVVEEIQKRIYEITKQHVEVMIFGDGSFKDPVCGIWELADPVVSPFYTKGLMGTPNELKLKYLADSSGKSEDEIIECIKNNNQKIGSLGTTPRQIPDLVGTLSDLTSGSGDKGTPVVLIKRYSTKYGDD